MEEKTGIWDIVKKKALLVLVITSFLTFVSKTAIDYFINWYFNRELVEQGVVFTYNYTVSRFTPVIFGFYLILVSMITMIHAKHAKPNENRKKWTYTWRDIFKNKWAFIFFIELSFDLTFVLQDGMKEISKLSYNYAFSSLESIPIDHFIIFAVLLAMFIIVLLQNTLIPWMLQILHRNIIPWFTQTEHGKKAFGILVLGLGIVTTCVMCGINYAWTKSEDIMSNLTEDYIIGEIIPIDIPTVFWAVVTFWFAAQAKKYNIGQKERVRTGVLLAIISIIISFTPLQMLLQYLIAGLFHGTSFLY